MIKEEYIHDCIQMDLPPGMPLSDHHASLKLPPSDHYGQQLPSPQLSSESHGPPPVTRFASLPVSPKGHLFIVEWLTKFILDELNNSEQGTSFWTSNR